MLLGQLYTESGERLRLESRLRSGGEGEIWKVRGADSVVKRYHPEVLGRAGGVLEGKLRAMVTHPPRDPTFDALGHRSLAWPVARVYERETFVGLVMPKLDLSAYVELHGVANPSDRASPQPPIPAWVEGFTWRYLIRTAINLASTTAALHESDYVIGDFNEANILVSPHALVTLVDCDSMQVPNGAGPPFLCRVHMPRFLAPELYRMDLRSEPRPPSSDLFALAVHIFQLLMEGSYPFDGVWRGRSRKPLTAELVRRGIFAHSGDGPLAPQRAAPPFEVFPEPVRRLFRQAFEEGAVSPERRPSAATWTHALEGLARNLTTCSKDTSHEYSRHLGSCPWCERARRIARQKRRAARERERARSAGASSTVGLYGSAARFRASGVRTPTGTIRTSVTHAHARVTPTPVRQQAPPSGTPQRSGWERMNPFVLLGLAAVVFLFMEVINQPDVAPERWQFQTGDWVRSSPAVSGGTVYVGSEDGHLYAIDAAAGGQRWRFETEAGVWSSPAVSEGVVYVGSEDGSVYAVDAATGSALWRFRTGAAVWSSPAVSDGLVYVGNEEGFLYAIDARTGEQQWSFRAPERVRSSPAVSGGVVYVGSDQLYAVDALSGEQRWSFDTNRWVWSSPAVSDGTVYVGSEDGNVYAVDAVSGRQQWRFETGGRVWSSPAVVEDTVYIGSNDGSIYALDAQSGESRWRFGVGGDVLSSPAVSGGVVYVGGPDGNLYALDAADGAEHWRVETGGQVWSSPAVADGLVYVGSRDGRLYAVPVVEDA